MCSNSEGSGETAQMRRLAFAGHLCDKYHNLMSWLKSSAGIEVMANRFGVIQTQIKKKPYDFLDQRKQEFAQDYEDFQRQIKELHVSL